MTPYQRQAAYRDRKRTQRDRDIEILVSAFADARTTRMTKLRTKIMNETNTGQLLALIARFNLDEAEALHDLNKARRRICKAAEKYISGKNWGLCEVQTKDFECVLASYYIGDLVEYARYGHYYVPSFIFCKGCCYEGGKLNNHHVNVWIELDNHIIKSVQVKNPETGEPERESW